MVKAGEIPRINGRHPGCRAAGTIEKIIPKPEGTFVNESVVYTPTKKAAFKASEFGVIQTRGKGHFQEMGPVP